VGKQQAKKKTQVSTSKKLGWLNEKKIESYKKSKKRGN